MQFLPDVYVPCEVCKGKRYNREALEIHYKGKSIADVLEMTIAEALDFFAAVPKIQTKLQTLYDVGLGYVHLGPAGDDALGRRGAARQALDRAVAAGDRPDAVRPRRADDGPALRRRREAARGPPSPGRRRQHGPRHRAQPRRHQDGRLDRRPRPGGRRPRRPDHRRGHARGDRRGGRLGHRGVPRPGAARRAARAALRRDLRGGGRTRQHERARRRARRSRSRRRASGPRPRRGAAEPLAPRGGRLAYAACRTSTSPSWPTPRRPSPARSSTCWAAGSPGSAAGASRSATRTSRMVIGLQVTAPETEREHEIRFVLLDPDGAEVAGATGSLVARSQKDGRDATLTFSIDLWNLTFPAPGRLLVPDPRQRLGAQAPAARAARAAGRRARGDRAPRERAPADD